MISTTMNTINSLLQTDTSILKDKLLTKLAKQSYREGKITLVSGKESNYYIDGKLTSLDSEGGIIISILFLRMLKPEVTAVGGIVVGACSLASGASQISYLLEKPLDVFYIRKEPKGHGTQKWIEGPLKEKSNIAILEDVVTTGGSSLKAVEKVKEFGCNVKQVLAIVDRNEGGREAFAQASLDYSYLFDISEVIDRAKDPR